MLPTQTIIEIDRTLKELMNISRLKEHAKLRVHGSGAVEVDESSLMQGFWRLLRGEGRETCLARLENIYSKSLALSSLLQGSVPLNLPRMRRDLTSLEYELFQDQRLKIGSLQSWMTKSLEGLNHLNQTYKEELTDLSILHNRVQTHLDQLSCRLKVIDSALENTVVIDRTQDLHLTPLPSLRHAAHQELLMPHTGTLSSQEYVACSPHGNPQV